MAVDNTKRVTGKVTALSVTRDGNTMKVSWKIPSSLTDENRADRATFLDSNINFNAQRRDHPAGQVWHPEGSIPSGARTTTYTGYDFYWVKGIELRTSYDKPYDRSRFHPVTKGAYCHDVAVSVHGGNYSGVGGWDPDDRSAYGRGPDAKATYRFEVPRKPVLSDLELDTSNGRLSCAMDLESGGKAERYDTMYRILRQDSFNAKYKSFAALRNWTSSQSAEIEPYIDIADFDSLTQGQWAEVKFEAYSRGMAGDSATASKSHVFAWPAQPVITKVTASSLSAGGIVTVKVDTRSSKHAPVDSIELERRKGESGSWESVATGRDNGTSSGFSDSAADALSGVSAGTHVYYRVKAAHDSYVLYSEAFDALCLYRALPKGSAITFATVEPTASADGIRLVMGWNAETSEYTGTEVSWSTHEDAWESSMPPTTANVTWKDATSQVSGKNRSASLTIYGLEQGTAYYVRARRYLESESGRTYGDYCSPGTAYYPFIPTVAPRSAALTAPSYIPRGSDVPLSWTFDASSEQTGWAVWLAGTEDAVIASGDDAYGACTVPASKFEGMDSAEIYVAVTTGSGWAYSEHRTVRFADPPEVTVGMSLTSGNLTAQPISLSLSNGTGDEEIRFRVVSEGVTNATPQGDADQTAGYVVFDAWTMPDWYLGSNDVLADIDLPEGLELVDNGSYTLECWARNRTTGLVSEMGPIPFVVAWSHQAAAPSDVTVTTYQADRVAVVTPTAPSGAASGDVFDVYRVTPDGTDMVAQGLAYGSAVSDRYAPFGATYRVATRTKDGDVDWTDADYEMKCNSLRIDWGESYVELPYNIVRQDSWAKDFERRQHLDGSRPGFWNEGASRDASLSTDLIRLGSEDQQAAVRELASYAGPCFVRLPNGCAYQANVDVSGLSESYGTGLVEVQLSASQVDLTDEFRVGVTEAEYAEVQDA